MRFACNHPTTIVAVLVAGLVGLAAGPPSYGADWYVSPSGKDASPGTREQPLASLEAARDAARQAGPGPHRIVVMPGEYYLPRPLDLDPRDNALTLEAAPPGKATLFGGVRVTGWRRDGEKFWSADLPGVKEGRWDFRALVVNGRMPSRARLPESGTFLNQGTWNQPLLPGVAGHWERKPTHDELVTMPYDPKDIPAALDVKNAEIRLYHMWDESLVGVARNDTARHALILSSEPLWPPGALGLKKYIIWNTREGLTQPGQWYLDRSAGRVVYWPLAGEDLAASRIVAPTLERIIRLAGTSKKNVEKVTIRGLVLQATTPPLRPASFGAGGFDGALSLDFARECVLEGVEICNVGGLGLVARSLAQCRIAACKVHHVGACGVKIEGADTKFLGNHVHHVGVYYPSAAALMMGGRGVEICRNEIHDAPYSGIIGGGKDHRIEENLIYRVMQEMQDGAAIYGGMKNSVLRGNIVRDVVKMGEGFGVSAYYLDEGARDCLVERNVSVGVARPTHNHIARNITIRDNVFIADQDMALSFQSSAGCVFERNTLLAPGKITVVQPNAIKQWTGNVIFRGGLDPKGAPQAFTIDDAMPAAPAPAPKTWPALATRVAKPPALNGEISPDQWPGKMPRLDRDPSRQSACGAPVFMKLSYDDHFLYVAVIAAMFEPAKISGSATWGQDDGAEVCIQGKGPDGKPAVFVVRGYANGTVQSVTDAGAPADAARRLGQGVRYAARIVTGRSGTPKGWRGQWAIPLEALGIKPSAGLKIPFNLGAFCSEFGEWHCWDGTGSENWRVDRAGTLQLQ